MFKIRDRKIYKNFDMKYKICNEEEKKTESNEYSKIIKKKTEKAS